MKSAITLCRVAEAAAGPFVFHDPLEVGFEKAAKHGFDAVELFFPGPEEVTVDEVKALQEKYSLDVAAVGTGAGMVKHGLSLTDPDATKRANALDFIKRMIDFGGQLGAPAILGSMQGRHGGEVSREKALDWLAEALNEAGSSASNHGVSFIYEPLNRYETNLFNQLKPAADYLDDRGLEHIVILADMFHMAIEEVDLAEALTSAKHRLGHVHWADSNRRAMGLGHTEAKSAADAIIAADYKGYISAEVFPLPDADAAAEATIASIRHCFG